MDNFAVLRNDHLAVFVAFELDHTIMGKFEAFKNLIPLRYMFLTNHNSRLNLAKHPSQGFEHF